MADEIDYGVGQLKGAIEALAMSAQEEADAICQPYWDRTRELRNTRPPKEWFKYAVHLKPETRADGTLRVRLVWSEMNWIRMSNGKGGKEWKIRGTQLKTNAAGKYSIGAFSKAGPEEKALIQATLEELDKVYGTLKLVGSMRKSIANTFRKYRTD